MTNREERRSGFTLVELAIVLVIIGLLVGGVLAGQELIEVAHRNKSIKTVEDVERAVATFRAKYNAIPGDMRDATRFFTGVTNGDGNGRVDGWNSTYEHAKFWTHLSAAGLYNVNYTNYCPNCGLVWLDPIQQKVMAVISYEWPLSTVGWYFTGLSGKGRHAVYYWGDDEIADTPVTWNEAGFYAKYIGQIDIKIDDGKVNKGFIISNNPGGNDAGVLCASGVDYLINDETARCITMWYMSF